MSQKVSDGLGTKARDAEEIKYGRKLDRLNASDAGTKPSYLLFPLVLCSLAPWGCPSPVRSFNSSAPRGLPKRDGRAFCVSEGNT